jgi:hypothetical protein
MGFLSAFLSLKARRVPTGTAICPFADALAELLVNHSIPRSQEYLRACHQNIKNSKDNCLLSGKLNQLLAICLPEILPRQPRRIPLCLWGLGPSKPPLSRLVVVFQRPGKEIFWFYDKYVVFFHVTQVQRLEPISAPSSRSLVQTIRRPAPQLTGHGRIPLHI